MFPIINKDTDCSPSGRTLSAQEPVASVFQVCLSDNDEDQGADDDGDRVNDNAVEDDQDSIITPQFPREPLPGFRQCFFFAHSHAKEDCPLCLFKGNLTTFMGVRPEVESEASRVRATNPKM